VALAHGAECEDESTSLMQLAPAVAPALAPTVRDPTRLHILSMGRSGSCFWGDLFGHVGQRPYIFEPFKNGAWGSWQEDEKFHFDATMGPAAEAQANERMECAYQCRNCWSSFKELDHCNTVATLVIKTVAMFNTSSLLRLPHDVLKGTKFLLMLRDPRSMTVYSVANRCRKLLELSLTIKDLAQAVGPENVRTLFYEEWSRKSNLVGAVEDVGRWSGLTVTPEMMEAVQSPTPFMMSLRHNSRSVDEASVWLKAHPENLQLAESSPYCRAFFGLVGYPLQSQISAKNWTSWPRVTEQEAFDALPYDRLRDPSKSPMTPQDRQLLEQMQAEASSFQFVQDPSFQNLELERMHLPKK